MTTLDVTFVTLSECVLAAAAHKVDAHMAKLMQHDPSAPRSTPMMYLAARLTASCETCIRMRLPGAQSHTYEPSILRGWFGGDDYIRYLMLPGFIFHISIVSELLGIDCARVSFLAQEEIATSCAGAVGCDITQLPGVEIGLSDDRRQVRTLATSLAAHRRPGGDWRSTRVGPAGRLPSADSVGGLAALFGQRHEAHVHEWSESQVLNDAIVLTGPSVRAEQFEAAAIMRRHQSFGRWYASDPLVPASVPPAERHLPVAGDHRRQDHVRSATSTSTSAR
jgi:hypothetical protein